VTSKNVMIHFDTETISRISRSAFWFPPKRVPLQAKRYMSSNIVNKITYKIVPIAKFAKLTFVGRIYSSLV
jgi:hypothetical protein